MSIKVYGIKNCDTVKKALKWLTQHNIAFDFHDFKTQGLDIELAQQFINHLGLDKAVNKRSTSYRQLTPEQQQTINTKDAAAILTTCPTLVKRPVLNVNGNWSNGFNADQYKATFSND